MTDASLELAVIGNCQVAALLDGRASIRWLCLPRPDGDPVFSGLMNQQDCAGTFAVELSDLRTSEQRYIPNTAIVETTLRDGHGSAVRITDFCPRFRRNGRMFRPMGLTRIVEPVAGRPVVRIRLRPTQSYGARSSPVLRGSNHLRFCASGVDYRVTTDCSLTALADAQPMVLDRPMHFLLGPDETVADSLAVVARSFLDETRSYWKEWVRSLAIPFDWQEAVIRAAITLKLCTYEDTGALLAALTTSIPESPGTVRNWDYRYCWLRDSYFVVQALNRLGATRTMDSYLRYFDNIVSRTTVGDLQPVYGIGGETMLEEFVTPSLSGFRGMGPVRVGNAAAKQNQHDVYGSIILAATQQFFDARLSSAGDGALFERLQKLGENASAVYDLPDAGPWELRNSQSVHSFSAAMCWAGCDRLMRIARHIGNDGAAMRWRATARLMQQRILKRSWNERRQAFTSTFEGEDVDATALLLPDLGLVRGDDPRFAATVEVVERDLRDGDLIFRYRHADDFGLPQTSFAICAFWYVNALDTCGRREEARAHFERLLGRRTALGLLSEDISPDGELWGNFPQAYSMVGVINSAVRLSRSWEDAL